MGPALSASPVTLTLLLLNVGVSLYALLGDAGALQRLSFRPRRIVEEGEYYRFLTAGFVHAGLGHLAVNMLTLYFFGPVLERILGPGGFLLLYFGAEMGAHALTFVFHRDDPMYGAVGASGAISGVVFAFCLFQPFAMLLIFFAIPMPAILFAVVYVVGSIYAMQQESGGRGGIAHEAHLGGALTGLVLTILLEPRALPTFLGAFRDLLG
jgi:membrane associated rhomboid family serine protease